MIQIEKFIRPIRKKYDNQETEELIKSFEEFQLLCGIDEVGRGPLAGPVVSCAIIMPKGKRIEGIKDSKKISEKKRNILYKEILGEAIAYGIGVVSAENIDTYGIKKSTHKAMKEAINNLKDKNGNKIIPEALAIDYEILDVDYPQLCIPKADDKIYSVSCASIVAKVFRDNMMINYSKEYPNYELDKNKGYGTKKHIDGLITFGLAPIHRKTFIHMEQLIEKAEKKSK